MAKVLVTDALWQRIQPLLPPPSAPKRPDRLGRHRIDDRKALTGVLFSLKKGINWEDLPAEMGWGCQTPTVWRE
jgi:transposase